MEVGKVYMFSILDHFKDILIPFPIMVLIQFEGWHTMDASITLKVVKGIRGIMV